MPRSSWLVSRTPLTTSGSTWFVPARSISFGTGAARAGAAAASIATARASIHAAALRGMAGRVMVTAASRRATAARRKAAAPPGAELLRDRAGLQAVDARGVVEELQRL